MRLLLRAEVAEASLGLHVQPEVDLVPPAALRVALRRGQRVADGAHGAANSLPALGGRSGRGLPQGVALGHLQGSHRQQQLQHAGGQLHAAPDATTRHCEEAARRRGCGHGTAEEDVPGPLRQHADPGAVEQHEGGGELGVDVLHEEQDGLVEVLRGTHPPDAQLHQLRRCSKEPRRGRASQHRAREQPLLRRQRQLSGGSRRGKQPLPNPAAEHEVGLALALGLAFWTSATSLWLQSLEEPLPIVDAIADVGDGDLGAIRHGLSSAGPLQARAEGGLGLPQLAEEKTLVRGGHDPAPSAVELVLQLSRTPAAVPNEQQELVTLGDARGHQLTRP
mmetsp:Transcript_1835/g.6101  ORF Transcript_1835/g.6101 Transcript_1835/m.6101 type:complete len:335 (+) Transcript_1835:80-1084(+)